MRKSFAIVVATTCLSLIAAQSFSQVKLESDRKNHGSLDRPALPLHTERRWVVVSTASPHLPTNRDSNNGK
jgi:hypothetical protein